MTLLVSSAGAGDQSSYGSPSVANVAQGAFEQGFDAGAFPLPRVTFDLLAAHADFDLTDTTSQAGSNVRLDFSAARPVTSGGRLAAGAFGTPGIANVAQGAFEQGFEAFSGGVAVVNRGEAAASLVFAFTLAYTAPTAYNTPFYFGGEVVVTSVGAIAPGSVGTPAQVEGTASLAPVGLAAFVSGVATAFPAALNGGRLDFDLTVVASQAGGNVRLDFSLARPVPAGAGAQGTFGVASLVNVAQGAFEQGVDGLALGTARVLPAVVAAELDFDLHDFYAAPTGVNVAFGFGSGRPLIAPSIADTGYGTAQVDRGVGAEGFADDVFGTPGIQGPRTLTAEGDDEGAFGLPMISELNRYVVPSGFEAIGWGFVSGSGQVALGRRKLGPATINPIGFGTTTIGTVDRTVDVAGRSIAATAFGTQFIAERVRFVFPVGISSFTKAFPAVDQTHYVDGVGFEAILWGVADVHDNRQFPAMQGFDTSSYGTAEVTRSPRVVAPVGFPSTSDVFPSSRWGIADLYNLRQYLYQVNDASPDEGGVFGSPFYLKVENRNRTLGVEGILPGKVGKGGFVENTGIALLAKGFAAGLFGFRPDGEGFIAPRIRYVAPTDPIEGYVSHWGVVSKPPQLYPAGIAPGDVGTPAWSNPWRVIRFVGNVDSAAYGTAFIAPRVRGLEQYYPWGGRVGMPQVELWTRYLEPPGISPFAPGAASVWIHWNIAYPRWKWQADTFGSAVIRNLTPQLYPFGKDQAEFGTAEARWNPYPLAPQPFVGATYGHTAIEFRTKTLRPYGIDGMRWGVDNEIRLDQPDLPFTRTFAARGAESLAMGVPAIRFNQVWPIGWLQGVFGSPTVIPMGAWVPAIQDGPTIGTPTVIGPRYLGVTGILAPDDPLSPEPKPVPRLDPFTIYCTTDVPEGYTVPSYRAWQLMDAELDPYADAGLSAGQRPFFGQTVISNYRRYVFAAGRGGELCGEPTVESTIRVLAPSGVRPRGVGFPKIPHTETLGVIGGAYSAAMGTPFVQLKNRSVGAMGSIGFAAGTTFVSFFNRFLNPVGSDMALYGAGRIHPPEPTIPVGTDTSLFGTAYIDFRYRTLFPLGWEEFVSDYTLETFDQRMRVTGNDHKYVAPTPIQVGEALGYPMVDQSIRNLRDVGQIRAGGVPAPEVRFQTVIALGGYGWDSSLFGDVQRWEAGKIKPQGQDYALYGDRGRMGQVLAPGGFDAVSFGTARRGESLDPVGIDPPGLGVQTITHADGLDFVCGLLPRAIPPQGFETFAAGSPTVN